MSIKLIDFSEGIRDDEINNNFRALQEQINRERKNVGGAGIAAGLEITPIINQNDFSIEVSAASIISNTGEEIFIPQQKIDIELPKLAKEIEYLTCNASNQVTLKHIPYSLNRRSTVETSNIFTPNICGINIKYRESIAQDDYIRVRAVNDKTISLSGITKREVIVTYYYTGKRIDTIYIDKNNELKVISSTTSPTPSIIMPNDYKYLVAFIEIDGLEKDLNGNVFANISVRKDLRGIRNIYTDNQGELWICGVPFKNLQIIHLTEPKDPIENTMWYDSFANQLKVWKTSDKLVYMNKYTVTTDYSNNINALKDYSTDMYYYVGKNQLEVYVNDIKLEYGKDFIELVNGVSAEIQEFKNNVMSNSFRILCDLILGDKIVYKITNFDAHEMWMPVNHTSFINAKDIKMFSAESEEGATNYFATERAIAMGEDSDSYPFKYQYFIFDRTKDLNMLFTPDKHELSVMINQIPLHADQFEEITIYDLFFEALPSSVVESAKQYFGWDDLTIDSINGDYENVGIGFKLKQPIDVDIDEEINGATDLYVEAIVQRRVNDGPLKRKLQRTATFNDEKTITLKEETIIEIDEGYYRFGENQLEVYIDGTRLIKEIDFFEGTDLSEEYDRDEEGNITGLPKRRKGAKTKQFTLAYPKPGSKLTYKITTSIYTYDHVNELLEEMDHNSLTAVKQVEDLYNKTVLLQENVEGTVEELTEEIQKLKDVSAELDENYLTKDTVLSESQMPPRIISNSIQSLNHISTAIKFSSGVDNYSIKQDCREEDFIVAIKRDVLNQTDKLLIRGVDYNIYNTFTNGTTYVDTILSLSESMSTLMNSEDIIILTGLKIGKVGR